MGSGQALNLGKKPPPPQELEAERGGTRASSVSGPVKSRVPYPSRVIPATDGRRALYRTSDPRVGVLVGCAHPTRGAAWGKEEGGVLLLLLAFQYPKLQVACYVLTYIPLICMLGCSGYIVSLAPASLSSAFARGSVAELPLPVRPPPQLLSHPGFVGALPSCLSADRRSR